MKKFAPGMIVLIGAFSLLLVGCGSNTIKTDISKDVPVSPNIEKTSGYEETAGDKELVIAEITESEIVFSTESDLIGQEDGDILETETEAKEQYPDVIESYSRLFLEQASAEEYQMEKRNELLVDYYHDNEDGSYQAGYCSLDLNDDGQEELLIGVNSDSYKGTIIIGLYTMYKEEVVLVCASNEERLYYLAGNGAIYNKSTSSDGEKYYRKFRVEDGKLSNIFVLSYNESRNKEKPWYMTEKEKNTPITKDEAKAMVTDFYDELVIAELTEFGSEQLSAGCPPPSSARALSGGIISISAAGDNPLLKV